MRRSSLTFLAVAWFATQLPAQTVIFSTYDGTTPAEGYSNVRRDDPDGWLGGKFAVPFATDSTSYTVNSAVLNLEHSEGGLGDLQLRLFDSDDGLPGSPLGTFTNPASVTSQDNYTFTASGMTLSADTSYWLVLEPNVPGSGTTDFFWYEGTSGEGYKYAGLDSETGLVWGSWFFSGTTPPAVQLNATPIPEPSTYAACAGLAVLVLGLGRRAKIVR